MGIVEALTSLAQTFTIIPPPTPPPSTAPVFRFGLTTPVGVMPNLSELISNLPTSTVTEIRQSPVTLEWLTKDVRFVNTEVLNGATVGGMPISSFIVPVGGLMPPNIADGTFGPVTPPGVPGVLGSLSGSVPIPIQVTRNAGVSEPAVRVTIRWRIRDESGNIVPHVNWSLASGASGTTGEIIQHLTTNYRDLTAIPPADLTGLLALAFPILFVELLGVPRPLARRTIEAAVRLEVLGLGVATDWVELPPVTIELPVVGIPTVLVLTTDSMFGGEVLVVVPNGSPLENVGDVTNALGNLTGILSPLMGTIPALGLFLTTFAPGSPVINALAHPNLKFRRAEGIPFLRDVVWVQGIGNAIVNFNGEDSIDSLAFIGAPNRRVECFNDREFIVGQGQMDVTVGPELVVTISDLRSAAPPSNPAGRASVRRPPGGTRFLFHGITTFGDELSSLRFSWA